MNQKIIGLDETGIFEGSDDKLRLIGGFVKRSMDPAEDERELETFFRELLAKINAEFGWGEDGYHLLYPYSLHMSSKNIFVKLGEDGSLDEMQNNPRKAIHEIFAPRRSDVCARITSATMKYLRENEYRLYALVDSGAAGGTGSNVIDFEVAGNRYERLAILALYHTVFYQVEEEAVDTVDLHLATRSLYVRPEEDEAAEAAKRLYGQSGMDRRGARYFANTTISTFKTALADKYYEAGHLFGKMDFTFHVSQANYRKWEEPVQPFLYLADIVCSYLRQLFLHKAPIQAKEECPVPLDIWVYGPVDRLWRRALERYQEGKLNESFALLYEMKQGTTPVHDYYRKFWAERLEKQVLASLEAPGATGQERRQAAFSRMPVFLAEIEQDMMNYRLERGLYLADRMREILERIHAAQPRYAAEGKRYLFQVHDLMLRGLNYRGAVAGLVEHIDECDRYRSAVQVEDYIYHIIRVLQYYFNSYQFERAEEVAVHLEATVGKLMEAYQEYTRAGAAISGEILGTDAGRGDSESLKCLAAGRLYSTLGQTYAFLGKYGPAKKHFAMAQRAFGAGENYRITLCHELQLYVDQKKQAEYERAAREFFGTDNLWEQWRQMVEGLPRSCYGLQAYLKAFRVFYAADRSNEYLVKDMLKELVAGRARGGHPWQIIYENLYQIVHLTGVGREKADWLRDQMLHCTAPEPCVEVMTAYYQILAVQKEKGDVHKAVEHFRELVQAHGLEGSFSEMMAMAPADVRKICRYLEKKIRYEYI